MIFIIFQVDDSYTHNFRLSSIHDQSLQMFWSQYWKLLLSIRPAVGTKLLLEQTSSCIFGIIYIPDIDISVIS